MWQKTKEKLCGLTTLKHSVTKEICSFGKKGELWLYNNNSVGVLVYESAPKTYTKLCEVVGSAPLKGKGEKMLIVNNHHTTALKKLLSISKSLEKQVKCAEKC